MAVGRGRSKQPRKPFLSIKGGDEIVVTLMQTPDFNRDPLEWANGDTYPIDVDVDGEAHCWPVHCEHGEADNIAALDLKKGDVVRVFRASVEPEAVFLDGREELIVYAEREEGAAPAPRAAAKPAAGRSRRPGPKLAQEPAAPQAAPQADAWKADSAKVMRRMPSVSAEFALMAVETVKHIPTGKKSVEAEPVVGVFGRLMHLWQSLGYPETPGELRRRTASEEPDAGQPAPDDADGDDIPF
jgi:hypothetical protein